jgi:hypothetical protein
MGHRVAFKAQAFWLIYTLIMLFWSGLARGDEVVATPDGSEVRIGNSYDTQLHRPTYNNCLDPNSFVTSAQVGLNTGDPQILPPVVVSEVTDNESMSRRMNISVETSVSFIFGSAEASANWDNESSYKASKTAIAVHEEVLSPPMVILPKSLLQLRATDAAASAVPQIRAGRVGNRLSLAGVSAAEAPYRENDLLKVLALTGDEGSGVRLKPMYEGMLRSDPDSFRRACGDSFVAKTYKGGSLNALMVVTSNSSSESSMFAAELSGSYGPVDLDAKMSRALAHLTSNSTLEIHYARVGGVGIPVAVSPEDLIKQVKSFPADVGNSLVQNQFTVVPYTDLPSYQSAPPLDKNLHVLATQYDRLLSVYQTLVDERVHPENYYLDENSVAGHLQQKTDDVQRLMKAIATRLTACASSSAACSKAMGDITLDDWQARRTLAAPKAAVSEREVAIYQEAYNFLHGGPSPCSHHCPQWNPSQIVADFPSVLARARFDYWIRRAKDDRCEGFGGPVSKSCITEGELEDMHERMVNPPDGKLATEERCCEPLSSRQRRSSVPAGRGPVKHASGE